TAYLTRLPPSSSLLPATAPPPPPLSTLSLHDALPISLAMTSLLLYPVPGSLSPSRAGGVSSDGVRTIHLESLMAHVVFLRAGNRSEEHTSELQSRFDLVCRLLLEKKNKICSRLIRCSD